MAARIGASQIVVAHFILVNFSLGQDFMTIKKAMRTATAAVRTLAAFGKTFQESSTAGATRERAAITRIS